MATVGSFVLSWHLPGGLDCRALGASLGADDIFACLSCRSRAACQDANGISTVFLPTCKDVMNDWYCLIVSALSKNAVFVLLHRAYVPLYDSSPAPCATVPATGTAVATRNALLPLLLLAGE